MKSKNGIIELYRFISAIIIMVLHSYHLNNITGYPCKGGYIFVEAFFALTGYFTYFHFMRLKNMSLRDNVKEDFKYTKRKFSKFLPYTFLVVFASLIVRHIIILKDFQFIMVPKAILESLMLIRGDANVGVLWYLSALLWIFPFFCFSCRIFRRKTMLALSFLGVVIYYGFIGIYDCFAPIMFARAFAGLLLGVVVFELSQKLKEHSINSKWLKGLGGILLITPIILTVMNIEYNIVIISCFTLGFAYTFSGWDTSEFWKHKIWSYLGKWSFSLYLVHLNIADFICWISKNIILLKTVEQYLMYIILTVIGVVLLEVTVKWLWRVVSFVKEKQNIVQREG